MMAEKVPAKTPGKVMLTEKLLTLFEGHLRGIFALKISRSTFREMCVMVLNCTNQNNEVTNLLLDILLSGQIKSEITSEKQRKILERVIESFTIPARLSREISERGDFVNIVSSDLVSKGDQFIFINRVRRIDGNDFDFMSDPQNTVNVASHFVGRILELSKNPKGKLELDKYKKELGQMADHIKQLVE